MELTDLQRLKKVVKWLIFSDFGDNEKEIAELLGYKKASFSQLMNGKVPLSDKFIDKLVSLDNNINKVWIKTGSGSMLKNPEAVVSSSQPQENDKYIVALEKQIALLEKNISLLEKENALQEKEIKRLEKEIERLKGKNIYIMEEKIENQRKEINALKSQNTGTSTAFSSSKRV